MADNTMSVGCLMGTLAQDLMFTPMLDIVSARRTASASADTDIIGQEKIWATILATEYQPIRVRVGCSTRPMRSG